MIMLLFLNLILLISITLSSFAQTFKLEGTIVDEQREPVPFAQVALSEKDGKSPVAGAISRKDGSFSLQTREGTYDITIIFVGYKTKKINAVQLNKPINLGTTTAILQADYVHPFTYGKLETGYKSTFRSLDNDYDYEVLIQGRDTWM
jgi:hypothetical protein